MARCQPEAARRLAVTGDDLGASEAVNRAIERGHTDGVLTHASLLVNGPALDDAVRRARRLPGLGLGLHLALADARPVTPARDLAGVVEPDGSFPASPARAGWRLWRHRRRLRQALAREIRAQFERFSRLGLSLEHVDGHHHLHLHPVVAPLVAECVERAAVRRVRLMREDAVARRAGDPWRNELHPALHRWLCRASGGRVLSRWAWAERVYGLRASGRLDARYLGWLMPRLQVQRAEIYCHPSRDTPAGRVEEAALCAPAVRRAIGDAGFVLADAGEGRPG
ncbi:MAG: ChbG/HpnK family deacetylase [Proteobacteria bacterium]|nr:ChbG/HpnK family deacetylase [Pseudomonadota bacterium]